MHLWFNDYTFNDSYYGINDASIELFSKNQMEELTREMIQNSLDAIKDIKSPVIVDFSKSTIRTEEFPNHINFKEKVKESIELANIKEDTNSVSKLNGIIDVIDQEEIDLLIISDYNTTGLTGVKNKNGSFNALLNSAGFSYKDNLSSGSFGFGKNAAFLFSDIRTVFYNTLNIDKEYGFQGVSILSSGKENENISYPKKMYPKTPIIEKKEIPFKNIVNRKHTGTDIIIAGYSYENWELDAIISIAANFFYAIKKEKLIVKVNKIILDHKSLESIINKLYIKVKNHKSKYTAYQREKIIEVYNYIHLIATEPIIKSIVYKNEEYQVQIYYNLHIHDELRKVIGLRTAGMKNHEFKYLTLSESFIALIYTDDEKLNKILRSMENPTHNKWEAARCEYGESFGRNIIKLMRNEVMDLIKKQISINEKSIEIESLEGLLKLSENQKKNYQNIDIKQKRKIRQTYTIIEENKYLNKTNGIKEIYEQLKIRKKVPKAGLKNVTNKYKTNLSFNMDNKVYEFSIKKIKENKKILIEFFYVNGQERHPLNIKVVDQVNKSFDYSILKESNQLVLCNSKYQDQTLDLILKNNEVIIEVQIYEL